MQKNVLTVYNMITYTWTNFWKTEGITSWSVLSVCHGCTPIGEIWMVFQISELTTDSSYSQLQRKPNAELLQDFWAFYPLCPLNAQPPCRDIARFPKCIHTVLCLLCSVRNRTSKFLVFQPWTDTSVTLLQLLHLTDGQPHNLSPVHKGLHEVNLIIWTCSRGRCAGPELCGVCM